MWQGVFVSATTVAAACLALLLAVVVVVVRPPSSRAPPVRAVVGSLGSGVQQTVKPGVHVPRCDEAAGEEWAEVSCADAYAFTWRADVDRVLWGLPQRLRDRLETSMGFCPHRRCQLWDGKEEHVRRERETPAVGRCPRDTCFTQIEHGQPTFGACCFHPQPQGDGGDGPGQRSRMQGLFNKGDLIGFWTALQPNPKPIYKHSRVVLGCNASDETEEAFIAANEVFPGIVATQCPLVGYPDGHDHTVDDVLQMMVEQNIGLVIQLAPFSETGTPPTVPSPSSAALTQQPSYVKKRFCGVWPLDELRDRGLLERWRYPLPDIPRTCPARSPTDSVVADNATTGAAEVRVKHDTPATQTFRYRLHGREIKHHWFHKWGDYRVPATPTFLADLRTLAEEAASTIRAGHKVLISCNSGRGRSGTLAVIVAAMLSNARSNAELVDLIVRIRRARDGAVETPAQFRVAQQILGLPLTDEASCRRSPECLLRSVF